LGESVTIQLTDTAAVFHSRSSNEYYNNADKNKNNAEEFRQAFSKVVEKGKDVQKKLQFAGKEQWGALIPSKTYLVTPVLIYLNILVFILMVIMGISFITPDTASLIHWGGDFRSLVKAGEWWRLSTYMFLHAGIIHLLANMLALLYIGMYLEPLLGRFRFATAYLLTGICAGLTSIVIHQFSVGVGASGAIFGMYGFFLALLTTNYIQRIVRNTMLKSILFFVTYNLLYGMKGNVDNAAHIGGLVSGFFIGYVFYPSIKQDKPVKPQAWLASAILAVVLLLSATTVYFLTDVIGIYQSKMKQFANMEAMALEVYKMDSTAPKKDILYNIKDRGIYYWNEEIKLLHEIADLGLPVEFRDRNEVMLQYCNLRIKSYELLYKKVDEGSNSYDTKLAEYDKEITHLLDYFSRN